MTDDHRPAEPSEPEADDPPQSRPTIVMRPQVSEPRKPLYRVVEVVRTSYGRLAEEGRVWHSDLAHVRRFGRVIAGNTSGHRVVVVDGAGAILEELSVVPQEQRSGNWEGWKKTELPPLPQKRGNLRAKPPTPFAKPRPPAPPAMPAPSVPPALPQPDLALEDEPEQAEATDTQPSDLGD